MNIIDFESCHIEPAVRIAKQNYEEERGFVPALPLVDTMPDMKPFADNGLGVAAFEEDTMLGFLCAVGPFENAFRSTNATGVFSPMGANGAIGKKCADIYARMYQSAAEKWVRAGASSHAICLYAHNEEVQGKFFRYGFGIRCADAVRAVKEITTPARHENDICELLPEEYQLIFPLNKLLIEHLHSSPSFMCYPSINDEQLFKMVVSPNVRYFATIREKQIIAYIKIANGGENFACDAPDMISICGAYCLPEYRGTGITKDLLSFVIEKLRSEGYARFGVDFETFNPPACGFWTKYFTAYTYSVVRRIDEYAIGQRN